MDDAERRRKYQREFARAARAKRKAMGLPPKPRKPKELSPEELEARRARGRAYYSDNREQRLAANTEWREANRDRMRELVRAWQIENRDKVAEKTREWRARDLDHARALARKNAARIRSTPWGDITQKVFRAVRQALRKGGTGISKYHAALGYTWAELHAHIEAQFTQDMSWDNWGPVWEFDHIVPLSATKYSSLDDPLFKAAWSLENLRPLPKLENRQRRRLTP
jgi:hypothetical protein